MKPEVKPAAPANTATPATPPQQVSPVYLLTVARRAKLGSTLKQQQEGVLQKLATARALDASVRKAKFAASEAEFHEEILLAGVWGILETFLTDITVEFLTCLPGGLQAKTFSLEGFAKSGSGSSLLREAAEKEVNDLSYKTFPEMLKRFQDVFNFKRPLNEMLINELNEVKCTRDAYVHAQGKVSHIYLRRAGGLAREQLGRKLPLGKDYLGAAIDKSERLVNDFFARGPANYVHFGRVKAFREMWEASCLNRIMAFDEAWLDGGPIVKGGEHIVRPTQRGLEWGWSHSEKALYDFFLGIYSPNSELRTTDTIVALGRFPPSTPEGQIIISWMESPFWF
jgi:hypothetical protein